MDTLHELDQTFGSWRATGEESDYDDPELHDPRQRRRTEELLESEQGDFASRFAAGTGQFDLRNPDAPDLGADAPIATLMTRRVTCARPDMDASEARARMLDRGVSGLPVVNNWGRAIGVVSKTDLVEHEVTREPSQKQVADIMMPLVFWLPPDASIAQAAALMSYEGIHRVVVVDRGGYLVGVVSSLDIARWVGRSFGALLPERNHDES